MAELKDRIKTALGETRTLILGSQVLLGFQFRGAFQDGFDQLPPAARRLDAVALVLMLAAVALLIFPSLYHRIAAAGRDSFRVHRVISLAAGSALLPFALGIGIDILIAAERLYGFPVAVAAGAGFTAIALFFWFGIEALARWRLGAKERAALFADRDMSEQPPLHAQISQMQTEARVVLPGAQALLGFQLAIVLTQSFERLPASSKLLHALGLMLIALSTILLMAPAAYHRLVYAGEDSEDVLRRGSAMLTAATVPLALGIGCDVHVVIAKIAGSIAVGAAVAAACTLACLGLWHLFPLAVRRRRRQGGGSSAGR